MFCISAVAHLVEALWNKPEGPGHWDFSCT